MLLLPGLLRLDGLYRPRGAQKQQIYWTFHVCGPGDERVKTKSVAQAYTRYSASILYASSQAKFNVKPYLALSSSALPCRRHVYSARLVTRGKSSQYRQSGKCWMRLRPGWTTRHTVAHLDLLADAVRGFAQTLTTRDSSVKVQGIKDSRCSSLKRF